MISSLNRYYDGYESNEEEEVTRQLDLARERYLNINHQSFGEQFGVYLEYVKKQEL